MQEAFMDETNLQLLSFFSGQENPEPSSDCKQPVRPNKEVRRATKNALERK